MQGNLAHLRQENEKKAAQEESERHKQRLGEILHKLQPPKYWVDQVTWADRRRDSGGSFGEWIFEHPSFQDWRNPDLPGPGVLFMHGKPGAGEMKSFKLSDYELPDLELLLI
jgi:hypothetical protein